MNIKTTKTLLSSIVALLTFLLFFQACEKGKNRSFVGTQLLKKNEIISTSDKGKKIILEVIEINDTRCPMNANCISIGSAKILIKFTDELKDQTVELCRGGCYITNMPTGNPIISLNGHQYELALSDITPFPTIPAVATELQIAKVVISPSSK